MKRKIMMTLTVVTLSLTVISCGKMPDSTKNSNIETESSEPALVPKELESSVPPKIGTYDLKRGEFYSQKNTSAGYYGLNYVNRDNNSDKINFIVQEMGKDEAKKIVSDIDNDTKRKAPNLKKCTAKYMAETENSTDQMPYRLIKKIKHPNDSDIIVYAAGYNIFGNCYDDSPGHNNLTAKAIWADGKYKFQVDMSPSTEESESRQKMDKFLTDYLAAIRQK